MPAGADGTGFETTKEMGDRTLQFAARQRQGGEVIGHRLRQYLGGIESVGGRLLRRLLGRFPTSHERAAASVGLAADALEELAAELRSVDPETAPRHYPEHEGKGF